jgi:hypothetical protein
LQSQAIQIAGSFLHGAVTKEIIDIVSVFPPKVIE